MFFLSLLSISGTYSLYAEVEDHLKPIAGKSDLYKMRNIDFIYLINLDERPEKLAACLDQLTPYGITPCRFSAINGWEISAATLNDVGVVFAPWMQGGELGSYYPLEGPIRRVDEVLGQYGRTYFYHQVAPGAIGCVLSHLSILQDAYDAGYQTVWIMEDDIEIIRNPHLLSSSIENLDALVGVDGWDILFTDRDSKGQDGQYVPCFSYAKRPNFSPAQPGRFAEKYILNNEFRRIGARYGSYSMILHRTGIEKLLKFIKNYQIFLPYDMEYTQPNDIRLFTVLDDIVSTQPRAPTDNGRPDYKIVYTHTIKPEIK